MKTRYLPIGAIVIAAGLFVAAAAHYPGDAQSGYDWSRHYVSTLFAAAMPDGAANPARGFALPAMLVFCAGIAVMFAAIARRNGPGPIGSTIQIGGIGSMVYAFLAVATPLHDLLVSVALAFFVAAQVAILWTLHAARRMRLLVSGVACMAIVGACAVSYYGDVLHGALAVAQKLVFVVCTVWLTVLYCADFEPAAVDG